MSVMLRDSRHAARNFGLTGTRLNSGTPRHKFQFFVNFRFNGAVSGFVGSFLGRRAQERVSALVRTVSLPNIQIETEVINQYNRRKVVPKRVTPQSVTLTFHDTVDGLTLKMWEMFYEYYYRDGVASLKSTGAGVNMRKFQHDVVSPTFDQDFGYNLDRVQDERFLLNSVEIFQVHGGQFTQINLVNPTVSNFSHDTASYEDTSGLMQFTLTLDPEAIVYENSGSSLRSLGSSMVDRFRRGDFWEMSEIFSSLNQTPNRNVLRDTVSREIVERAVSLPTGTPTLDQARQASNVLSVQSPLPAGSMASTSPFSASALAGKVNLDSGSPRPTVSNQVDNGSRPVSAAPPDVRVNPSNNASGVTDERGT